ncbi:MAG: hypothetical protein GXO76_00565 [Calditrichaeota bacterium]|nr:hypothetical protein [Calditrichota bacterium]
MGEKIFTKDYPVRSYEYGPDEKVTLFSLLNYMQDAAVQHSRSSGFSIEDLFRMGYTWVLYQLHLIIEHHPKWNDTVIVQTWPYKVDNLHAIREFHVASPKGDVFARASSVWILIDFQKKRPVRIPDVIRRAFPHTNRQEIPGPFSRIPRISEDHFRKEFTVRWSDLDSNKHANNTKFAEWCYEAVPADVHPKFEMHSLEITFKKEALYGEQLLARVQKLPQSETGEISYLHDIQNVKTGSILAQARTLWKESAF